MLFVRTARKLCEEGCARDEGADFGITKLNDFKHPYYNNYFYSTVTDSLNIRRKI